MEEVMKISKYHRKPVKDFDLHQTLYNLVINENKNNQMGNATGFLGFNKTYANLFNEVDLLADAYVQAGIKENDVVAICTISTPAVQQNLLALSKIGAVSKWIDLRSKDKEIIKNINESGCKIAVVFDQVMPLFEKIINETDLEKVLISSPKDHLPKLVKLLADYKDKKNGKFLDLPEDKRFIKLPDFIKTGSENSLLKIARFDKEKPTIMVQSSGSTGLPKTIVHTDFNFNAAVFKIAHTDLPLYKGKTLYVAVPPFIIYGLANSIYLSLVLEMKAEMTPYVAENTVYDDLGKFDVPFGAPVHYRYMYEKVIELKSRINKLEKINNYQSRKELRVILKELNHALKGIKRVEVLVSGGDKMSHEEIIKMQNEFHKTIVNGYGNNEVVGAAVVSPRLANKPGSIGIALPGVEAEVFDPETKELLKQGEKGELCLHTDNAFLKYDNNQAETDEIKQLHSDGKLWIHTGDLAIIDEEGYINLVGRSRRVILKDAFKISPDAIENILEKLTFVKKAVVVGVDDEVYLNVPMGFIELKNEYKNKINELLPQIEAICQQELPDHEIPSYFQEIDKILYTPNNKIDFISFEKLGNELIKKTKKLVRK